MFHADLRDAVRAELLAAFDTADATLTREQAQARVHHAMLQQGVDYSSAPTELAKLTERSLGALVASGDLYPRDRNRYARDRALGAVPGYPGYGISSAGRVLNLGTGQEVPARLGTVLLYRDGVRRKVRLDDLMAAASSHTALPAPTR